MPDLKAALVALRQVLVTSLGGATTLESAAAQTMLEQSVPKKARKA